MGREAAGARVEGEAKLSSMGQRGSLRSGFLALSHWKLVVLLTLTTVLLGLSAAVPLLPSFSDSFADTLAGDHILRNHPTFAPTDVFDFLREKGDAIAGTWRAALWFTTLGLLVQIFFAGGFVELLGRSRPFSSADFFLAARHSFWHNTKCLFLFLITAALVLGSWLAGTGLVSKRVFEGTPPGTSSRFLAGGLLLFSLIALEWSTPAVSAMAILLHTVLQIAILSVRPAVRVAAWGSYLALFDSAQLEPALTQQIAQIPRPPADAAPSMPTLDEIPLV